MKKQLIISIFIFIIILSLNAQKLLAQGIITGYILDSETKEPLPGANVLLEGTGMGTSTDSDGHFIISNIPTGKYFLSVQIIGYRTEKKEVIINSSNPVKLNFEMHSQAIEGETIVVTGTRIPRYLKDTPIRTDVVTSQEINRRNPTNFLEATQSIIGIDPSMECSICNAASVSLQGLPGRYTQVLIDGIPLFSSLGQTYGYLELPANIIDQLEIIKGANSVLYGSDAIAGIVNIKTSNPSIIPKMNLDAQFGEYGEKRLNGSASFKPEGVGILINGEFYSIKPVDRDNNGLTEFAGNTRSFMHGKFVYQINPYTLFNVRISGLAEERQGGAVSPTQSFIEVLDSSLFRDFTESILTKRIDIASEIKHDFSTSSHLTFKSSYTHHFQDSDYEGFVYVANQNLTYNEIQYDQHFSNKFSITGGLSFRTEKLDENTAIHPYHYKTGSIFLQLDYLPLSQVELVLGLRYDHHNIFGNITTPSVVFKKQFGSFWTLRMSYGQGFRAPTTFYELDHGTGAKYKYNTRYIANKAERSSSINLSMDFTKSNQNFAVVIFYHRIHNYINAYNDYITRSFVVQNIESPSSIYGLEVNYRNLIFNKIYLTLGYIFEKYKLAEGVLGHARPEHKFKWSINHDSKSTGISVNLDGQVTGPMELQRVYGISYNQDGSLKRKNSPTFSVVNAEIAKTIGSSIRLAIGAKNIFDFQQTDVESPLMYDKSGELGDVIYLWGPLLGRKFYTRLSILLD